MSFKAVDLTIRRMTSKRVVHRAGATYHEHNFLLALKQTTMTQKPELKVALHSTSAATHLRQRSTRLCRAC
jgi:hypothetical protein